MWTRTFAFAVLCGGIWAGVAYYDVGVQPAVSPRLAVGAMNGGDAEAADLRAAQRTNNWVPDLAVVLTAVAAVVCFRGSLGSIKRSAGLIAVLAIASGGCMRDYDKPEYQEVDTAETAFLIPLEGNTTDQTKFESERYLNEHKIAAKRVQIVHRWNQTGRFDSEGQWISSVRLIKVNRSPVTREWTADVRTGSADKNQAIWVESQDSVGFSMGFTVTGHIKEEDAALFLYWYPSTNKDGTASLASTMDTEVRAHIQQAVAEVAAKYPLDLLRAKKSEMAEAARKETTEFFAKRGITITTVAAFGGMTYENPKIQEAIDRVFIAQQEKDVNLAAFEAQQKANERITLEADATAEKARKIAKGEADAKTIQAKGEADALLAKAQAAKEAGAALFQLRELEIEQARVEKWDGRYPVTYFGSGQGGMGMMLNVPAPVTPTVPAGH